MEVKMGSMVKILYYALFAVSILMFGVFTTRFMNEIVYDLRKSRKTGNKNLRELAFKLIKRMLKVNAILLWIAYETYVKGRRPNTYSIGSWLFNIRLVEGKEPYIIGLIIFTFIIAYIYAYFSKERVIKAVSIDKRTILKKKVKSWDETKLSIEEKEELLRKWYGYNNKEVYVN